jgi:cytosine/adenosine deaminase-related metal-dependent hydrolase
VTGSLTPGTQADIVVIRAEDLNNMPLNNAVGTVVLGADTGNVDKVLVAGRARKWGQMLGVRGGNSRTHHPHPFATG